MKNSELIDKISQAAISEFKQATNKEEKRKSCCRYLKRGMQAELSQGELIDILGISTPSILSLCGYTDDEELEIMELLGDISDSEIANIEI